jgi:hypothetical protein
MARPFALVALQVDIANGAQHGTTLGVGKEGRLELVTPEVDPLGLLVLVIEPVEG